MGVYAETPLFFKKSTPRFIPLGLSTAIYQKKESAVEGLENKKRLERLYKSQMLH